MKLHLEVVVQGRFGRGGVTIEIPELIRECFEPLKVSDEPLMAWVGGGVVESSQACRTVLKTRKDAAEILSKNITEMLLAEMGKRDTHNGYGKE